MTIFVNPYHTTAGTALDISRVITPLKECTILDPLQGTNLSVRSAQGITPVFITGCRDSERRVPPFTHSILIKNLNGKSYLFTDMRLFIKAGATLDNIEEGIRRREEFDFTKSRAIASLAWAAGEQSRFLSSLGFCCDVFAEWVATVCGRAYTLDFIEQTKVKILSYAFYRSLFEESTKPWSEDEDFCMVTAKRIQESFRVPMDQTISLLKNVKEGVMTANDLCYQIVKQVDNVSMNPRPGSQDAALNLRVLLNLLGDAWFATNSKQILATALEHPPTLCAIIYQCINYSNFKRQQMGSIIQSLGRGGKAQTFSSSFAALREDFRDDHPQLRPVMEYLDTSTFVDGEDNKELDKILKSLHEDSQAEAGSTKDALGDVESIESLQTHL